MPVPAVTNSATDYILQEQKRKPVQEMGKDQFMHILLTQLQNQDPSAPMDNAAMIAQMAQFSALESMQSVSTGTTVSQAYSMIGKGIVGVLRDEATGVITDVCGPVDSAGVEAGKPYVKVGEKMVWLKDVSQVFNNSILAGDSSQMLAGTAMVGKYIKAEIPAEDGTKHEFEGKVDKISLKDGNMYVSVNGTEVGLYQILNVADSLEALG